MTAQTATAGKRPRSAVEQALEYLRALWPEAPAGHLLLWRLADKRSQWLPSADLGAVAGAAVSLAATTDVYLGCALSPRDCGPDRRCKADEVLALPGLWADIDVAGPAHKKGGLPPDTDTAMSLAESMPRPPSLFVLSGHGVYAWWLFEGPWLFGGDEARAQAAGLARRWQAHLAGLAGGRGWGGLDNTSDLARVLRLPGTVNRKREPVPVTMRLPADLRRYDPSELLDALPPPPKVAAPAAPPAANGTHRAAGARGRPDVRERAVAYLAKCQPAVSGQGGHDQTFSVARAIVYGFDLGPDVGFGLLESYYNPRCQPPWSEKELRHKCAEADAKPYSKPRGWLLSEDSPRPEAAPGKHEGNGRHERNGTGGSPGDVPPTAGPASAEPGDGPHPTDVGNARRLVERHGEDLRHCHPTKTWYVWDKSRWAEDQTGEVVRRVKEAQQAYYRDVLAQFNACDTADKARMKALQAELSHALKWEDTRRVSACIELARCERPVVPADLDRDDFVLNVRNGTLDLRTGRLRPHRRGDLITKLVPVAYDPDARCPLWVQVLDRVMGRNAALVGYLQRVLGYALTGDVSEQCLWLLHGAGANGKSTVLGTFKDLLGDYACQAVSELLMARSTEAHPTERADLAGRRFVATIETDQGKRMAESLMKQLTGGDSLKARRMRQDFIELRPTWKVFLAANHKPTVRGCDLAVWRRIKLLPFTVTIPDAEKDKHLKDKLRAEWPGILAWAVEGCLAWQRDGLKEPEEVQSATREYQAEQDTLGAFLQECCFVHSEARVKASVLLDAYCKWSGEKDLSSPTFNARMREKGYESKRSTAGYFYLGMGIKVADDEH